MNENIVPENIVPIAEYHQETVIQAQLPELRPFPGHPFKVRDDEAMRGMLVADHWRKRACELADHPKENGEHHPQAAGGMAEKTAAQSGTVKPVIEFLVLAEACPWGAQDQYVRRFLTEDAYGKALQDQEEGSIRVYQHASIIEGHILPDKARKRRRVSN